MISGGRGCGASDLEVSLSITERRHVKGRELFSKVLSSENFLGDNSSNGHHGGTSVVKLSVLLTDFLSWFLVPVVDLSKSNTVVPIQLGCRPPSKLDEPANQNDLGKTSSRKLEKASNSRVDIRELEVVRWGHVSIERPLVVVDKSSEHGHHGNASVLALNSTVTNEFGFIRNVSKRIEESKRSGGSNIRGLEESRGRNSLRLGGWGEGSSRASQ
mmetsp:Transcript_53836/g.80340  ORF Transcript_53836/g.80340 Transcript_53836/m.80340 type:complete len:215 (-) Transcript_53836:96-740(-)